MTTIVAPLASGRELGSDSFGDLTDAVAEVDWAGGLFKVTLTPDVSDEVVTAVRCRIISRTDAGEAARSALHAALALPKSTTAQRLVRLEALVEAAANLLLEAP